MWNTFFDNNNNNLFNQYSYIVHLHYCWCGLHFYFILTFTSICNRLSILVFLLFLLYTVNILTAMVAYTAISPSVNNFESVDMIFISRIPTAAGMVWI